MDMHQAGTRAEWTTVLAEKRTLWQRIAYTTSGFVTPGNIVSVLGLVAVVYGLVMLVQQHYLASFLLVGIGRIADVVDGAVAHATKTKSPLGEALDAGIDKLELLAAVVALLATQLAPLWLLALIIITNSCTAIVSGWARLRGVTLHPVRTGKLATFVLWVSIGMYIGHAAFQTIAMQYVGTMSLSLAAIMSAIALAKYVRHGYFIPRTEESGA